MRTNGITPLTVVVWLLAAVVLLVGAYEFYVQHHYTSQQTVLINRSKQ